MASQRTPSSAVAEPAADAATGFAGRQVLVTGAAGFLGGALTARLVGAGAIVTAVDLRSVDQTPWGPGALANGGELWRLSVEEYVETADLTRFTAVFHCAGSADHHLALEDPEGDLRSNLTCGLALLVALRHQRATAKVISLGSRSQYGRAADHSLSGPLTEAASQRPVDVQGLHKAALEDYHRVLAGLGGTRYAFVRLTNTYGPGQRLTGSGIGFFCELLRSSLAEEEVVVYGDQNRVKDLLFVDDAVEALIRLGTCEAEGPFNAGGRPCRVGEIVAALDTAVGGGLRLRYQPFPAKVARLDAGDLILDSGRLQAATGWRPATSLTAGVAAAVAHGRALEGSHGR